MNVILGFLDFPQTLVRLTKAYPGADLLTLGWMKVMRSPWRTGSVRKL